MTGRELRADRRAQRFRVGAVRELEGGKYQGFTVLRGDSVRVLRFATAKLADAERERILRG